MAEFTFNIEPGSSREAAHRVAVNKTFGAPIESFRYDQATGIIRVTTRAIPAFGLLEAESDDSKLVQRLIADYRAQDAVLLTRVGEADKREADILQAERKLVDDISVNEASIKTRNETADRDIAAKSARAEALSRQREQELDRVEGDLRQRENDLADERAAFEREKKGLPPLGIIAKAKFVLGGDT